MSEERRKAVELQAELCTYDTLPQICMELRMACNGSATPYRPEYVEKVVAMLKERLRTWEDSPPKYARFDNAVRELVAATIAEAAAYQLGRESK